MTTQTESIDSYHHCVIKRQIADSPLDLVFFEDDEQSAAQILQLSFDFAGGARLRRRLRADHQKGERGYDPVAKDLRAGFTSWRTSTKTTKPFERTRKSSSTDKDIRTAHSTHRPRKLQAAVNFRAEPTRGLQTGLGTLRQVRLNLSKR